MVKFDNLDRSKALDILNSATPNEFIDIYNQPYLLSSEQIDYYNINGFVKIERLLSGGALEYARKVTEAAVLIRKENDLRTLAEKSQYEQSFLQCGFLCWDFPAMKDLVFGKRFAGVARDLMGVEGARLWHDQALFKEAGGRRTDVHQDSSYWPVKTPLGTTTAWMALVDVPIEKGPLFFYPGTHTSGLREYVDIFKNPHHPDSIDSEKTITIPLNAGDATYHTGLTFHGALENKSNEIREAMTVIYIKNDAVFDSSDARNATHKSCKGLNDGAEIDTEFTPRLV